MARIAVWQTTSGIDPVANGAALADAIARAASGGATMVFAPEMAGLVDRDRKRAAAHVVREEDSAFVAAARAAAARQGIWVHLGSLPVLADGERWRNRSLVIDSNGAVVGRYDKIHLFDIDLPSGESWRESSAYEGGTPEAVVVRDTPVGALGLTICYDLRFPALFAALRAAGADVIAVPAAFTVPTGRAHWHCLLRARALDQGCFIVAAAQAGVHADGRETFGHSLVVDPWGDVIADGEALVGLSFAELLPGRIDEIRQRLPLLANARMTVSR